MNLCAICQVPITSTFDCCAACEKEYDLKRPRAEWPAWVIFCVQDEQARRYRERRIEENEVVFTDL
jgi:hypothetical protein